jgi:DNA repair exonuclease SbcCD nuclease subunit
MKLIITADIHIGVPGKLEDIMWALERVRQHCIVNEIKHWINLGDLFHDREVINIRDLYTINKFFEQLKKDGITFYTFPGNHDMFLRNSWDINSIAPLGNVIKSYDKISQLKLGGIRFWILPFIHYETKYMEALAKLEKVHKPGDVLLTHIGVKSSILNSCFLLKSWSLVNFEQSAFDRVYTGHYHIHQQVGHNVWYPGDLIPFKQDEGDVDHGFFVFDTDTRTHEFVSIWAGADLEDKATPPQFRTIDDSILLLLRPEDVKNNIVRIELTKEYTHDAKIEIKTHLESLGARDVRWMGATSKEAKESVELGKAATTNATDLFNKCVEEDEDGTKELDKVLLLQLNAEAVAEGDRRYEFTGDDE